MVTSMDDITQLVMSDSRVQNWLGLFLIADILQKSMFCLNRVQGLGS